MTKIALSPMVMTLPSGPLPELKSVRRLIVLVPPLEVDLSAVTRRLWELANATGKHFLLVGLYRDAMEEPSLRRELVTMSAMVNDGKMTAEIEVVFGRDWVDAVRARWQVGDMVVCFEEQRVGLSHRPLSQLLQSDLDIPLYILTGLYPQNDPRTGWPARGAAWIGSITIILGFFILQVMFADLANSWASILQVFSIIVEAWLILVWNGLFG